MEPLIIVSGEERWQGSMRMLRAEQFGLTREVEYGTPEQNETVKQIVEAVRTEGDAALLRYTEQLGPREAGRCIAARDRRGDSSRV